MARRSDSDEHYVLSLADEFLGYQGERQKQFDWLRGGPSVKRPAGTTLPIDGYWPEHALAVEFQERQHSEPVPIMDRRMTISGVPRSEQRRIYDERKRRLIPEHGIRLITVEQSAFSLRRKRIARDHDSGIAVVRCLLQLG